MNFLPQGTAAVKLKVAFSCLKRKYKKEIEIENVFCSMRHDYTSRMRQFCGFLEPSASVWGLFAKK